MDQRIKEIIDYVRSRPEGGGLLLSNDDLPNLEKLGSSRQCDIVWNAIERRLDAASEIHRASLVKTFGESFDRASEVAETNFGMEVGRLMGAIYDALRKPAFSEMAIRSKRKKVLSDAEKAAKKLLTVLSMLRDPNPDIGLSNEIEEALRKYAVDRHKDAIASIREWSGDGFEELAEVAKSPYGEALSELVAEAVIYRPEEIIGVLVSGIGDWAKDEPIIPRPSDKNADRLRMIRILTSHFCYRYGSPLRQQVLAVVGVFFDASDLAESDIAKLAPVRNGKIIVG